MRALNGAERAGGFGGPYIVPGEILVRRMALDVMSPPIGYCIWKSIVLRKRESLPFGCKARVSGNPNWIPSLGRGGAPGSYYYLDTTTSGRSL